MGSVMQVFPKDIVIEGMGQGPLNQSYNIGFNNMMGPNANTDPDNSEVYYRMECLSGSIVCKEGRPDANGVIKYSQVMNQKCTDINERHPGAIDVPKNCGNASRDLSKKPRIIDFKNWGVKEYVLAVSIGVVVIGSIFVFARRKKTA